MDVYLKTEIANMLHVQEQASHMFVPEGCRYPDGYPGNLCALGTALHFPSRTCRKTTEIEGSSCEENELPGPQFYAEQDSWYMIRADGLCDKGVTTSVKSI
jgi:hypothetical protein